MPVTRTVNFSRRQFIARASLFVAAPMIVPSSVWGREGEQAVELVKTCAKQVADREARSAPVLHAFDQAKGSTP